MKLPLYLAKSLCDYTEWQHYSNGSGFCKYLGILQVLHKYSSYVTSTWCLSTINLSQIYHYFSNWYISHQPKGFSHQVWASQKLSMKNSILNFIHLIIWEQQLT